MFDTATQLAAWTYTSTSSAGVMMAVVVGLIFTLGMVVTDTLDSRLMCRLLRRVSDPDAVTAYRRGIGWTVVALSYGIAAYEIAKHLFPQAQLGDATFAIVGLVLFLLAGYLWYSRSTLHNATFHSSCTKK